MRIISKRTIREFWEQSQYRDAEQPLRAWYAEAKKADWRKPSEVKQKYRSASILADNRVVFNIAGNKYRLVVKIHYDAGVVYIRFIGTHAEYNEISARNI